MRLFTRDYRLKGLVVLVSPILLALGFAGHCDPASTWATESLPPLTSTISSQVDDGLLQEAQGRFKPLPKDMATAEFPVTLDRVNLGRLLFFDPRISVDGTVSCARCHLSSLYATDGLAKSRGAHDKLLARNAPTVLNAALHFKQHWRGDFENVEEQAEHSLLAPSFANPDYPAAMARVKGVPGYTEMFRKSFPGEVDPVTAGNWGKAIGAYERTLVTPSRFDQYLGGKNDALSAEERRGLRTFIDTGCANCHNGAAVGGGKFRKFGVKEDYWKATGSKEIDRGRIDLTKDHTALYAFKVPGLRNVEMTPPYFHHGTVNTLPDAVRIMARLQLGMNLADEETAAIVSFLKSLTGKLPEDFANAPVLPAAGFGSSPLSLSKDNAK